MSAPGTASIKDAKSRTRIKLAGRIRSLRLQTAEGFVNLGCEISDETGELLLVFQGRPRIPGVEVGAKLIVEGMVGLWRRRLAIVNPNYQLVIE